jgi:hypothetical protein
MNNLSNTFIVGAAKAGTTSIFHYLEQSNEVFSPSIKEPNYFCKDIKYDSFRNAYKNDRIYNPDDISNTIRHSAWIDKKEIYNALYMGNDDAFISLDGSVSYLYSNEAAQNIYEYNKNSKIIILLRNPIERAFSHYLMNLQVGYVRKSFIDEVISDFTNKDKGWGKTHLYVELGLYFRQVERYLKVFPRNQVKIILFEELKNKPDELMNEICNFLNIENIPNIDLTKKNISKVPNSPLVFMILKNIYKKIEFMKLDYIKRSIKKILFNNTKLPVITVADKIALQPYFRNDINKLSKLLNINLEDWLIDE